MQISFFNIQYLIIVLYFLILIFIIIDFLGALIRRIPSLPTSSKTIKTILKILEPKKNKEEIFIDLGCGMGRILLAVKNKYPKMEVLGYENWPTQFLLAKTSIFLSGAKVKVFYKNLFQADLTKADIVFCYLFSHFMKEIEEKLEKELKKGAIVICSTFPLPNWKPINKMIAPTNQKSNFEKIFIYKK